MRGSRTIATLVSALFAAQTALASPTGGSLSGAPAPVIPPIPEQPSAPPTLSQTAPTDTFRCERNFTFGKKTYNCDSNVRQDGENLRPFLAEVPAATSELNLYQRNRRNLRNAAYMGSLGLAIALVGVLISRPPILDGDIRPGGFVMIGGLGLSTASFSYALGLAWANENHLENAVWAYNQARPEAPLALVSNQSFQQRYFKPMYLTSAGVATALLGLAINHPPVEKGELQKGGYLLIAGTALTVVSVFYGLGALGSGNSRAENRPSVGFRLGDPATTGLLSEFQITTRLTF